MVSLRGSGEAVRYSVPKNGSHIAAVSMDTRRVRLAAEAGRTWALPAESVAQQQADYRPADNIIPPERISRPAGHAQDGPERPPPDRPQPRRTLPRDRTHRAQLPGRAGPEHAVPQRQTAFGGRPLRDLDAGQPVPRRTAASEGIRRSLVQRIAQPDMFEHPDGIHRERRRPVQLKLAQDAPVHDADRMSPRTVPPPFPRRQDADGGFSLGSQAQPLRCGTPSAWPATRRPF